MILQHIVFPSKSFNPVIAAYMRLKNCPAYEVGSTTLTLTHKSRAEFNTFFNGFSIEKWKKYTQIDNVILCLRLKGQGRVKLYNEFRQNNENVREFLVEVPFESDETAELNIPIPANVQKGIVSFTLVCDNDELLLEGGHFYTEQDESLFPDVRFAIDICTFRREPFVTRNMEMFRSLVLAEDSPLKGKFEVFISDNGKSLDLGEDFHPDIHVFPNKNAGGAGGFGRAMIEILRSPNYKKFTHILMMDDDIVLSPETLYRTYALARTMKKEFCNAFIGGSMLELGHPDIQSEAMDLWTPTGNHPVKYKYKIKELDYVLKNEIEDKANHLGWWYCVMPIGVVKANNLPLPIFIKRDDIEYGIRNGSKFITLNGLCVLHEEFGGKRLGYLEYYYWRNMCILNSLHFPSYTKETLKKQLQNVMNEALKRYRYDDANLAFVGVEDFLRGVDWLKETDVEQLNGYVMSYTYKALPVDQLPIAFTHGLYEKNMRDEATENQRMARIRARKVGRVLARFKLDKLILKLVTPKQHTRYIPMSGKATRDYKDTQRLINYDEKANTAFVTEKSKRQILNLRLNYRRLCKLIDQKYDAAKTEYRVRFRELTSLTFWDKYLDLKPTAAEEAAPEAVFGEDSVIHRSDKVVMDGREKQILARDRKNFAKISLVRLAQRFAFVLPMKKNRIVMYVNHRMGFVCNPKYIAKELLRRYGDQVDLIWVTDYPESCAAIEAEGIKVVRAGSKAHWLYQLTAKAVVVNDAFHETVLLRRGQVTLNTWHACMNYKKIGPTFVAFRNKIHEKQFKLRNVQPKIYVSGSQYFTDDTSKSFNFDPKVFVPTGSPRNDIFFQDNKALDQAIRDRYALDADAKLLLYAPTFRRGYREDIFELDFDRLTDSLEKRFGGKWNILYRKHYFINGAKNVLPSQVIDVSDYDDMNELLAVSDALISDYSSCLWDFAMTRKPSFIYATDIDYYRESDRDFSYPLSKWPYPIARDNDELEACILQFNEKDYRIQIENHLKDGGSFDDGQASSRVVDALLAQMKLDLPRLDKA